MGAFYIGTTPVRLSQPQETSFLTMNSQQTLCQTVVCRRSCVTVHIVRKLWLVIRLLCPDPWRFLWKQSQSHRTGAPFPAIGAMGHFALQEIWRARNIVLLGLQFDAVIEEPNILNISVQRNIWFTKEKRYIPIPLVALNYYIYGKMRKCIHFSYKFSVAQFWGKLFKAS